MWLIDKSYDAMVDGPLMRKLIIVLDFPACPVGYFFRAALAVKALVFSSGIGYLWSSHMDLLALCICTSSPASVRLQRHRKHPVQLVTN